MSSAGSTLRPIWYACASFALLLVSCVGRPDHFYTLDTLPDAARGAAVALTTHVLLNVTVPPLVDRRQMVINASGDQVLILEHERWAGSLAEQVSQTLARDIERRRSDVLVGDRGFDQAGAVPVKIKVDIVQMSAQKGGRATIEAHWRIVDASAKVDEIGGDLFSAPLAGEEYAAVARGFSECLSSLADRLVEKLPAH